MEMLEAEIEIHKKLNHPNIIAFREYFMEEQTLIIIMEYCECKPLPIKMATCRCTSRAAAKRESSSRSTSS